VGNRICVVSCRSDFITYAAWVPSRDMVSLCGVCAAFARHCMCLISTNASSAAYTYIAALACSEKQTLPDKHSFDTATYLRYSSFARRCQCRAVSPSRVAGGAVSRTLEVLGQEMATIQET
jgi:hypothetical protein